MKIYEAKRAPNPRRVRVFLAEKGLDIEFVQISLLPNLPECIPCKECRCSNLMMAP